MPASSSAFQAERPGAAPGRATMTEYGVEYKRASENGGLSNTIITTLQELEKTGKQFIQFYIVADQIVGFIWKKTKKPKKVVKSKRNKEPK